MKLLFNLSGDCIDLAREEIKSLFKVKNYKLIDKLLIVDINISEKMVFSSKKSLCQNRLAFTKSIYKFLFECNNKDLIENMKNYDWNSIYKDNFCLRISKKISLKRNFFAKNFFERDLAKYIWHAVKNPKVNLENPKTRIDLFFIGDNVYCGLLVNELHNNFNSRKAHLRPFHHPSSLHPKIARALINLTGAKENECVLDPFCGSGGILIEAGLMGINVVGYDVDKKMIEGCQKNLQYFNIKKYEIFNADALKISKKFDYIVTDLPYGLNSNLYAQLEKINIKINESNKKKLEHFFLVFLKRLKKIYIKKAVIVFPDFVDYRRIIKQSRLKLKNEFYFYVHKNLSRKAVVLE